MSDHITPTQAQDFLEGYEEREDGAYYLPESIGKAALSMIAGAHYEYGVRVSGYPKNVAGWREFFDAPKEPEVFWFGSEEDADEFGTDRENDGYRFEYGLTRLVIDLPEEDA